VSTVRFSKNIFASLGRFAHWLKNNNVKDVF
jgi:hypothetical protein